MASPVLNTELVLESPERMVDTGGGIDIVWAPVGTHWADVEPMSARETLIGGREVARVTHRITIRSAPANSPRRPKADCRFRSGDRVFAIRGVADADRQNRFLTCWAEEGAFS